MLLGCSQPSTTDTAPVAPASVAPGSDPGDLCSGLVADRDPRPVAAMARPPFLTPVTDPAFGTRMIRITDAQPSSGRQAVIKPVYSTIQAWNADESLLILWDRGKGHQLHHGRTYEHIRDLPLETPTDLEQVYWDPVDPDVLYYPSKAGRRPRLMRYRPSTGANEMVRDFSSAPTNCPNSSSAPLSAGSDPMDMSWGPERVMGFRCGATKFLYSISGDRILGQFQDAATTAPAPSWDGKLAYYRGAVLDETLQPVRSLDLASRGEHASLGRGAAGALYGAVDFDGSPAGSLVVHEMQTARKIPIISTDNGWPYPPSGTHVSGVARASSGGWFAVSVVGNPTQGCVLCQELLLASADSRKVCRVAHHRSFAKQGTTWDYWSEPHVVISPSATRLLFASDWGDGPTVDTYVVELPSYQR